MPFIPHTPESLLPRSDSKNPAATCRGLTSTGRPCRRAIAKASIFSRAQNRSHDPEAYCWQHKEQVASAAQALLQGLQSTTIRERTSVDTLVDRLGLMEIREGDECRRRRKKTIPPDSTQTGSALQPTRDQFNRKARESGRRKAPRSNLTLFCCIGVAEDELVAPRPVRAQEKYSNSTTKARQPAGQSMQEIRPSQPHPRIPSTRPLQSSCQGPTGPDPHHPPVARPSICHSPSSRTAEFLSLIPPTATTQTTALLLAELAKPLSIHDEEGYIYMFWLTPTSLPSTPPSETASSLLSPPSSRPTQNRRRTSEVLQTFSNASADSGSRDANRTILLKIGRASNVQRRLNEWSRQCGHNLSLIRYYPYNPSSSPGVGSNSHPGGATPAKVPHVHRIERLIHIELADKRAKESGRCASCGSLHREWFEVEASRDGVRSVDEVVRRWADWGAREGS
jgi:Meiotically up-regulated gene 113